MKTETQSIQARAKERVAQMTPEEKAGLCSGLDCWHTKPVGTRRRALHRDDGRPPRAEENRSA